MPRSAQGSRCSARKPSSTSRRRPRGRGGHGNRDERHDQGPARIWSRRGRPSTPGLKLASLAVPRKKRIREDAIGQMFQASGNARVKIRDVAALIPGRSRRAPARVRPHRDLAQPRKHLPAEIIAHLRMAAQPAPLTRLEPDRPRAGPDLGRRTWQVKSRHAQPGASTSRLSRHPPTSASSPANPRRRSTTPPPSGSCDRDRAYRAFFLEEQRLRRRDRRQDNGVFDLGSAAKRRRPRTGRPGGARHRDDLARHDARRACDHAGHDRAAVVWGGS